MHDENILVWLPSPMGDAILCTPALRAIREQFKNCRIHFLARPAIREILSPGLFNDTWLVPQSENPLTIAKMLKPYNFTHAILFKNSFASALAVWLAAIPVRIGYAREGRSLFLTEKLCPPKTGLFSFKPASMIDYYLAIASWLGADTQNRQLELSVDSKDTLTLHGKLPQLNELTGPLVVMVPGGAFGLSKCWPADRFAQTADWLIKKYNAAVVISVSPARVEKQIAEQICKLSKHKLINLADAGLSLGQLKSLFSLADLVICNDTGPRHIAIALRRKLITMFGPNDPAWTETDYENEIQIVGNAPCAPCADPVCRMEKHFCMEAITIETVCKAAEKLLTDKPGQIASRKKQEFIEIAKSFFVDSDYIEAFEQMGLTCTDAVFAFDKGGPAGRNKVSKYRGRLQFNTLNPPSTFFLKRYDNPPALSQLKNWFWHRNRKSTMFYDINPSEKLTPLGINTPKVIAYGEQWDAFFEKRSFSITEKIPAAQSLEEKLPDCVRNCTTVENLKKKRSFIKRFAEFAREFHLTGLRHRDFYLAHIFYSDTDGFYLIDLQRVFKPSILTERFRVKDIAQLYYSSPRSAFSAADRLRFYKTYTGKSSLDKTDKVFIRKVIRKARRMALHDAKRGLVVPFTT